MNDPAHSPTQQSPWGFAVPQVLEQRRFDDARIRAVVEIAESAGVHSLWVSQQVLRRPRTLEALTLMAYVAALSRTVRIGSAVLLPSLHQPVQLAKQLASVDQLSNGRIIVGVGVGNAVEYETIGFDPAERAEIFEESVDLIRRLWERDAAVFRGKHWFAMPASIEVKPAQRPGPPLWFGGSVGSALRRAVRLGDGWVGSGGSSLESFRAQRDFIREELVRSGRDPQTFPLGKRVYVAVEDDPNEAKRRLARFFEIAFGAAEIAGEAALIGDGPACAAYLRELRDAGADLVILNPIYDEVVQYDRICNDVLPLL